MLRFFASPACNSVTWHIAGVVLALALVATPKARAMGVLPCAPCDDATLTVGDGWRVRVESGVETLAGKGDHAATVSVYRVEAGQCCLARTKIGDPGAYLLGVDAAHRRVFLSGHDARWAALATNGIWAYDVTNGTTELVASHIWRDVTCEHNPLRFAAILQTDPPQPASKGARKAPADDAPRPDPYRGTFRLAVFDLGADAIITPRIVATKSSLRAFDPFFDDALFSEKFHWSQDCEVLTYALSPTSRTKLFRMPTHTPTH